MIGINPKIILNKGNIKKLSASQILALEKITDYVMGDLKNSQTMPFKEGTLQNENTSTDYSTSKEGKAGVVSSLPYARRLYYHPEYNFDTTNNANAGGRWMEPYIKGEKNKKALIAFAKFIKQESGGVIE